MYRFWDTVIEPLLEELKPKTLVEIGCAEGKNTRNLLGLCRRCEAELHVIDPKPAFDVEELQQSSEGQITFHRTLSLNAIPDIGGCDAVLIDGDHNWYTVYNELLLIEKVCGEAGKPFPVVFLHDIGWPYGRRDLYYDPETIPEAYRKPYKKLGLKPGSKDLLEEGGLNRHLFNSIYENNLQNGVLTAVEDFLKDRTENLELTNLPGIFGLGILLRHDIRQQHKKVDHFLKGLSLAPVAQKYVEQLEELRVTTEIARAELSTRLTQEIKKAKAEFQSYREQWQARESDLVQRLQRLEQERSEVEKQLVARESELVERIQRLEHERVKLKEQFGNRESELVERTHQLEQKRAKIEDQLAAREQELKRAKSEINETKQLLEEEIARLRSEHSGLQSTIELERATWRAREEHLVGQVQELERNHERLQDELSVTKKRLSEESQKLIEKEKELGKRQQQLRKTGIELAEAKQHLSQKQDQIELLASWLKELDLGFKALLNSKRWRMGNLAGEVIRKLLLRKKTPIVTEHILKILGRFRDWRKTSYSEYGKSLKEHTQSGPVGPKLTHDDSKQPRALEVESDRSTGISKTEGHRARTNVPQRGNEGSDSLPTPSSPSERPASLVVDFLSKLPKITVLIPIFNAPSELRRCLNSVVRNTTRAARLLLIDDASTDAEVAALLREFEGQENVTVLRNPVNLGFVKTVNRGFEESIGDVILLNSDTEVGPHWLENMSAAAYSDPQIGTVTALTNNGGAFSVPNFNAYNELPAGLSFDETARLVSQRSARMYPETPTGNGFCMYIKRALLDDIGNFDAEKFPRGYGEENDFCMRARSGGWRNIIDDATLVLHARGASFGPEKEALMLKGKTVINRLYPEYGELVKEFVGSPTMAQVRETVRGTFEEAKQLSRVGPRVLFVVHHGGGGVPRTNEDLMSSLPPDFDCYAFTSDTWNLRLLHANNGRIDEIERIKLERPIQFGEFTRSDYREIISRVLLDFNIELVHLRHLFKHTFDAPLAALDLHLPMIVSLHDFYLSCPTVHLLDEHDHFCGGSCTQGQGACRIPSEWIQPPHLKHSWVYYWRNLLRKILNSADTLITTSKSAREIYLRSYPELESSRFVIIEHGRDLQQSRDVAVPPRKGEVIRIVVPGNLDVHKGANFLRELQSVDHQRRLEFHFMGHVPERYKDLGVQHGPYQRAEFVSKLRQIRPSFIGLFSICAETYSHTLTEAWSANVPVIVSNRGALKERVERHGGGWVIDVDDPKGALARIYDIADDPQGWKKAQQAATLDAIPSIRQMADEYSRVYRSVLHRRRTLALKSSWTDLVQLEAYVVGDGGSYPGSVHVRTLRPYRNPALAADIELTIGDVERFICGHGRVPDIVYVQRTAIQPEKVESFLNRCRRSRIPLVVDMDDHLLDLSERPDLKEVYSYHESALKLLLGEADLVTVSTPILGDALRDYCNEVEVVPNHLDEHLWFGPLSNPPLSRDAVREADCFRILYMGTNTHARDLALIRPAIKILGERMSRPVRLSVVGGEPPGDDQGWYERVEIPPKSRRYPRFVRWLRHNAARWDVAIAPLEGTRFNSYKSDLKFLEYSALKLPGVYSDVPAYSSTVQARKTGLLAGPDAEDWVEKLSELATDSDLSSRLAEEASKYVAAERTISRNVNCYLNALNAVRRDTDCSGETHLRSAQG